MVLSVLVKENKIILCNSINKVKLTDFIIYAPFKGLNPMSVTYVSLSLH